MGRTKASDSAASLKFLGSGVYSGRSLMIQREFQRLAGGDFTLCIRRRPLKNKERLGSTPIAG